MSERSGAAAVSGDTASQHSGHGEPSRHPAAGPATTRLAPADRPPSVDALARSLADVGLPHPLLVDVAREAIAAGDPDSARGPRRGSCAARCSSR